MQLTTNFKLKKIELKDSPPDITIINPNWDAIDTNLKTALDRANDWNDFKNGGGVVNGDVKARNFYAHYFHHKMIGSDIGEWEAAGLGVINSDVSKVIQASVGRYNGVYTLYPDAKHNNVFQPMDLGHPVAPWRDLWLNGWNRGETGYTKLTNGMILQWGRGNGTGAITFPVAFPNECLHVFVDGFLSPGSDPVYKTLSAVYGFNTANFTLVSYGYHSLGNKGITQAQMAWRSTVGSASFAGVSRWFAIGY